MMLDCLSTCFSRFVIPNSAFLIRQFRIPHSAFRIAAAALLLAALLPAPVQAQEQGPQDLLQRGAELASQERFEEAIGVWLGILDALKGEDLLTAHKYLALAYKRMEMLPEAWHYLTLYLESRGKEDAAAGAWLQEVEERLKQTHVKVVLNCSPEGLTLRIPPSKHGFLHRSAFRVPNSAFVWWLTPGKHLVHAEKPGFEGRDIEIDVRQRGDSGAREIRLTAVVQEKPPENGDDGGGVGGSLVVSKPVEAEKSSRALEWALIGSGLALGVTGGIFHGLAYSKNEDLHTEYLDESDHPYGADAKSAYDSAYDDEVRPKTIAAYVLYGVGGAAALAGAVLWMVRKPDGANDNKDDLSIAPLTLPGGAGAIMTLEW